MSEAWYARALDRARGVVVPTQRAAPAPQQFQPQYPPQYSQPQNYQPQNYPQQQQQVPSRPQAVNTQQKFGQASLSDLFSIQDRGLGQPGQGARLNPDPCPGCGGDLFIENLGTKRRGPAPAPHCFSCGWNGLFDQGLESSWASV